MGYNDHHGDTPLEFEIQKCTKCGKYFRCVETEQVIGCKSKEEKICPYCETVINTSMEYEYSCSKLTNEDKAYLKAKGIKIDK